jgi:hypothetical protein
MVFSGTNVKTGPGLIYVAPVGTTEPTTASAALPSAWRPVGYTEEGLTISYTMNTEPIEVAEEFDALRYDMVSREGTVSFQMAEVSRANLAAVLNAGAAAATSGSLEPPAPGSEVRIMIALDTNGSSSTANVAPTSPNARWVFRQVIQSDAVEIARQKSPNKALLTASFRMEKPASLQPFIVFPDTNGNV